MLSGVGRLGRVDRQQNEIELTIELTVELTGEIDDVPRLLNPKNEQINS